MNSTVRKVVDRARGLGGRAESWAKGAAHKIGERRGKKAEEGQAAQPAGTGGQPSATAEPQGTELIGAEEETTMADLTRKQQEGRGEMTPERSERADPFSTIRELMRFDPFAALTAFPRFGGAESMMFTPRVEVKETKDAIVVQADLPGVKDEDVEVSVTGNRLTICGERAEEETQEDERYYAYERSYGSFSRSFTLPEDVDPEKIDAKLDGGVLSVKIPKKASAQPKRIPLGKKEEAGEIKAEAKAGGKAEAQEKKPKAA